MQNLRDWLNHLHDINALAVLNPGVALDCELLKIVESYEGEKACFFPNPSGHPVPVVAGTLGKRIWVAERLAIPSSEILTYFKHAVSHPMPWNIIAQEQAPVHEVVHKDIDLKKLLPIVKHHQLDAGPYITCGLVNAKNPLTGKQNVSIHRMQVHSKDKLGILMLPRDLYAYYVAAEAKGEPLPITITIGHDPLVEMASQAITPRDQCELEIAGALQQKPLDVVKSYTNDVYISAQAEIAIEGEILPYIRALEGPFGEFPKYYSGADMQPVIQVKCITHRHNPIYKTNNPSGLENVVIGGVPREASLLERIQINFPNVLDLRLTPGGLGRYHLVIQMNKKQFGEAKNVIAYAFGCHYDIKLVIVVDEDIDIDDPNHIEWALATRFQAEKDLVILNHALGSKLDPSGNRRGLSSKVGLDATRYLDDEHDFKVSQYAKMSAQDLAKLTQKTASDFLQYVKK